MRPVHLILGDLKNTQQFFCIEKWKCIVI